MIPWQQIAVILLAVISIAYVLRMVFRRFSKKGGHSGCANCEKNVSDSSQISPSKTA